jgi:hypothetical protein
MKDTFLWAKCNNSLIFETLHILLKNTPWLLEFLFNHKKPELRCEPDIFIEEIKYYSHSELIITKAALDLWNGSGNANIGELLNVLDYDNTLNFIHSLCNLSGINEDLIDVLDSKLTLGHRKNN